MYAYVCRCVKVLEDYQRRLEREAENAASASTVPAQSSTVHSSVHQSPKASMLDGKPAIGFTNNDKNQSYSPSTEYVIQLYWQCVCCV